MIKNVPKLTPRYHTYNEMTQFLNEISQNYSDFVNLYTIGQSVERKFFFEYFFSLNKKIINLIKNKFKVILFQHTRTRTGINFLCVCVYNEKRKWK